MKHAKRYKHIGSHLDKPEAESALTCDRRMTISPRVPLANLTRLPSRVVYVCIGCWQRLILMMVAVFEDLGEHRRRHVWKRDHGLLRRQVYAVLAISIGWGWMDVELR